MASKTKETKPTEVAEEEEVKVEEKKRVQKPSRYVWDRTTVTLETVLIEIPKKSHRIPKPDYDVNEKKIKDIEE